jgi:hypothetical protein
MKKDLILNNLLVIVLAFLIIYCFIQLYKENLETLEMRKSNINDKLYGIQEELPNSHKTADKIAKIEIFIDKFLNYLNNKYNTGDDKRVDRLISRLHNIKLEESPYEPNTSSYTLNKGELISVCVRNKENKNFHDFDILKFVIIHELAHVASISTGHNEEFIINFKWLLHEAHEAGIYNPVDYSENPINYCGVNVTNNPML